MFSIESLRKQTRYPDLLQKVGGDEIVLDELAEDLNVSEKLPHFVLLLNAPGLLDGKLTNIYRIFV